MPLALTIFPCILVNASVVANKLYIIPCSILMTIPNRFAMYLHAFQPSKANTRARVEYNPIDAD